MTESIKQQSFGQTVVRMGFARDGEVAELKQKFADLIDDIDERNLADTHSLTRAIDALETACMYAVKALTA